MASAGTGNIARIGDFLDRLRQLDPDHPMDDDEKQAFKSLTDQFTTKPEQTDRNAAFV